MSQHEDFYPVTSNIQLLAMDQEEPKSEGTLHPLQGRDIDEPLKYRKRAVFLLLLYIPLVLIPWILTCIVAVRPLHASTYFNQEGVMIKDVERMRNWATTINVLNSIASLITIPIISALLAQAAVVFTQRRSTKQALSIKHLFALADRGWTDIPILVGSLGWREPGAMACKIFLWLAAALVITSAIQQPLYQILVPFETISIPTCLDTNYLGFRRHPLVCSRERGPEKTTVLGSDIEPYQMERVLHNDVVPRLITSLASVGEYDIQPNLWIDTSSETFLNAVELDQTLLQTLRYDMAVNADNMLLRKDDDPVGRTYFVAALDANATTGVLREHIMRMNSSVSCDHIERTEFPSTCAGELPITTKLSRDGQSNSTVRVCVPGRLGKSPWTLSRSRQDIEEEIFLDVLNPRNDDQTLSYNDNNFTIHCRASTTRGYFELGNYRNNYIRGPLLEKWPGPEEMRSEFNDYSFGIKNEEGIPSDEDPARSVRWDGYNNQYSPSTSWNVSGPLMVSAAALFGPTSFFHVATNYSDMYILKNESDGAWAHWQNICIGMPFSRLFAKESQFNPDVFPGCEREKIPESWMNGQDVLLLLNNWIHGFNDTDIARKALETSMFLTNKLVMTTQSSETQDGGFTTRNIYTSPGVTIQKPNVSLTAKITISTLIFVQFVGLALLTCFIYHVPTWTYMLNALAVARIAASLDGSSLPLIGNAQKGNSKDLDHISGVIGVVNNTERKARWKDNTSIELSETTRRSQHDNPFADLVRS